MSNELVHVLPRLSYGGAELLISELCARLQQGGEATELWIFYRCEVISGATEEEAQAERAMLAKLSQAGVRVRFLEKRPGRGYLSTWRTLRQWLKEVKPRILHVHLEEISFHTTVAALGLPVTIVQTVHNTLVRRPILYRLLFRRRHRKLIAISKDVMRALEDHRIHPPQAVYIPNGIDTKRFAAQRDPLDEARTIISVGRLSPQKNPKLMIEAFERLKDRWLNEGRSLDELPQLRILGEGELRPELETMIDERELYADISLEGLSDHVPRALASADIYLMASDYEGISLALMEAMASQLPIVVTRMTGAKELIRDGETGSVVPIGDAQAMADALHDLIVHPEKRARYAQNLQQDIPALDTDHMVRRYRQLYDELRYNDK